MNKKIVLVSCCKKKQSGTMEAKKLYCSTLFKASMKAALSFKPDEIYILSAKHHLLELNDKISSYDCTLNNMSATERRAWANIVLEKLKSKCNLKDDEFIFLAGKNYYKYLVGPKKIEKYTPYYKQYNLTGIGQIIKHLQSLNYTI